MWEYELCRRRGRVPLDFDGARCDIVHVEVADAEGGETIAQALRATAPSVEGSGEFFWVRFA